jgi:hypothetical protein
MDAMRITDAAAGRADSGSEERRARVHGMWSAVAPGWGRHAAYVDERATQLTGELLELAAPRPGERVLELASAEDDVVGAVGLVDPLEVEYACAGVLEGERRGAFGGDRGHFRGDVGQDDLAAGGDSLGGGESEAAGAAPIQVHLTRRIRRGSWMASTST